MKRFVGFRSDIHKRCTKNLRAWEDGNSKRGSEYRESDKGIALRLTDEADKHSALRDLVEHVCRIFDVWIENFR